MARFISFLVNSLLSLYDNYKAYNYFVQGRYDNRVLTRFD